MYVYNRIERKYNHDYHLIDIFGCFGFIARKVKHTKDAHDGNVL